MTTVGLLIVGVAGAGIFAIGLGYLIAPRSFAASFGLPVLPAREATPWLRLKGVRDLASGVVAGVLLGIAPVEVIGAVVLAFAIIPGGDALMILRAGGPRWAALGIHGATAVVMTFGAALLLAAA
ncbi:uncharacterized protein DUF4267 [Tamaricihabitans halophyticus]|uniref:Uncharacterized protein DUF4267 n=1 Tax=Tamaricihabitans halophyticus TaxID=1262583 RepID=A0A4R2QIQ8_9PSEU|nr:DUF4267 domain-containing protein [Tamaricihabitans halophyticus]TCP49250.1 uncharacterized protein DUF4267 [Tamaricihabitans halophyticus]